MAIGSLGAVLVATACNGEPGAIGFGSPLSAAVGNAACPELRGGAMNASFEADAKANATIRAFVTASGDLAQVAAHVESDVAAACEHMADDLGIPNGERRPHGNESQVTASCNAVGARIDAIMKQGAQAQVHADVTPPRCQVNASVDAQCRAQCAAQGQAQGQVQNTQASGAASGEARCESACKAHADLTAQCTEAQVRVQAQTNTGEMAKVVATLDKNLPVLIKAEVAYGQRIAGDVDTLVSTGSELPHAFARLSSHAGACVASAANATLAAQASLRVSVQASASVSAKAGASSRPM